MRLDGGGPLPAGLGWAPHYHRACSTMSRAPRTSCLLAMSTMPAKKQPTYWPDSCRTVAAACLCHVEEGREAWAAAAAVWRRSGGSAAVWRRRPSRHTLAIRM